MTVSLCQQQKKAIAATTLTVFSIISPTVVSFVIPPRTPFRSDVFSQRQANIFGVRSGDETTTMLSAKRKDGNIEDVMGSFGAFLVGLGISAQVAFADPTSITTGAASFDDQMNAQSSASSTILLSGPAIETLDFSMPSYDSSSSSDSTPKSPPSFGNPFGDLKLPEPNVEKGSSPAPSASDDTAAKEAEKAEKEAAKEAEKAEKEAAKEAAAKAKEAEKAEKEAAAKAAKEAKEAEKAAKEAEKAAKAEKEAAEKAEKEAKEAAKKARIEAEKQKQREAVERAKKAEEEEKAAAKVEEAPPAPKIEAPSFKAPDFSAPEISKPDIKIPEFKKPDIPAFKAPDVSVPAFKAPQVSVPSFKAPTFSAPEIKVPSSSSSSSGPPSMDYDFGGSDDAVKELPPGVIGTQEERDERAKQAKEIYKDADREAKIIEKQAKEARAKAIAAGKDAKKAKDEACATRPGGKLICLRGLGIGY